MSKSQMAALLFALVAIPLEMGCVASDDGRTDVSGVVELDGKPLAGATVAFIGGSGGGNMSTATTDGQGKFKARVALGSNKVAISKVDEKAMIANKPTSDEDATMGSDSQVKALMAKAPKSIVAPHFSDPQKSGLQVDIKKGMEPLSLQVSAK